MFVFFVQGSHCNPPLVVVVVAVAVILIVVVAVVVVVIVVVALSEVSWRVLPLKPQ